MTARPHDALFKWAFEAPGAAAALLRELLPQALRDAIAWDTLDGASGSFVDVALTDRHSDLLFAVRLRTRDAAPAYLLLEHQSTDDPDIPLRMLAYQTQIWVVDDLAGQSDEDLQARALAPFQRLALWLLRDARDPMRLLDGFDAWIPTILEAGQARSGADAITVLIQYLFQVLDPLYFDAVRAKLQMLGTRSKEIAVTIAEYLEQKGREEGLLRGHQEGLLKGREEGHREGRLATLRSLLIHKFQILDAEAEARLQAATPEAIDRYLRRVLTADSLAAVLED